MPEVNLAFFWHQHQPYYPDDVSGENPMPWVRLHGVKDYYGMALHLLEVPEMQCTINLVPSLIVQLQGYTERGARDMGHLPLSGPGGTIEALGSIPRPRKVLVHINNTNPILLEDSPERAAVVRAGIEIGYDGMEVVL